MRSLKKILFLGFLLICYAGFAQSVNLDHLGKAKLFNVSGGVAANTVFYQGASNRAPFNYFANGNLNINISGLYNIPLSFMYSNRKFDFPSPFKFNRLSLHPSYKWITAHIGDTGMTFSPYTLSGHQFSGFGVDLTPEGPFTISAMYGRLLRATEYDPEHPDALPAYKRMGYGVKTSYDFEKIKLGLIVFSAKDDAGSIENPFPAELDVSPKSNVVLSAQTAFTLFDKAQFTIEYATTAITEDIRANSTGDRQGFLGLIGDENPTTAYHSALKAQLSYPAGNGSVGAAYERVDPGYRTFGAYFFNNDLENITVNTAQQLFDNKVGVNFSAGLQRDDLDNTKSTKLQRIVSSVNVNYTPSEKLTLNGAYSNFQSYTNIRNQFDYINEVSQFDNVDTLNYRQVSQSANVGLNYLVKKTETRQQSLNLNLALQSAENQQNDRTLEESSSVFYNAAASYTMGYPKRDLNISIAVNATQNTLAGSNSFTLGPTLAVNKQLLEKKLRTAFSASYNISFSAAAQQASAYNLRLNSSYTLSGGHHFNLNLLSLFRSASSAKTTDFTATLGYSYSFDTVKLSLKKQEKPPEKEEEEEKETETARPKAPEAVQVKFRYRDIIYKGTLSQVSFQLQKLMQGSTFKQLPPPGREELTVLLGTVKAEPEARPYKEKALDFLDAFYGWDDFLSLYDKAVYKVIQKLQHDIKGEDFRLEKRYAEARIALDALEKQKESLKQTAYEKKRQQAKDEHDLALSKVLGHRWMEKKFTAYSGLSDVTAPEPVLEAFKAGMLETVMELYKKDATVEAIASQLEYQMIDFYYKTALEHTTPDDFKFKYFKASRQ